MLPYADVDWAAQDGGLDGGLSLWATMWGWAGTARSTMLFFAAGIGSFVACCGVALLVHPSCRCTLADTCCAACSVPPGPAGCCNHDICKQHH